MTVNDPRLTRPVLTIAQAELIGEALGRMWNAEPERRTEIAETLVVLTAAVRADQL